MTRSYITRTGISMAETIVATLIIGFVLVASLQIVGPMVRSSSVHADRLVAAQLAAEITQEIGTKRFTDPQDNTPDALGADSGERVANRLDFDDVDDFANWSSSPPKLSTNQSNTFLTGWTRSVKVVHVQLVDAITESATNTGLKRVTVTVSKNGVQLAQTISLQAQITDSIAYVAP